MWRINGVTGVYHTLDDINAASAKEKGFFLHYGYQTDENEFSTPPSLEWLEQLHDVSSYMNHSCDPNAGILGSILLVAMADIATDEEVCFDYAMCDAADYDEFICACGMPGCRKVVTSADWQRPELQTRYRGWMSSYLQRRIDSDAEASSHAESE